MKFFLTVLIFAFSVSACSTFEPFQKSKSPQLIAEFPLLVPEPSGLTFQNTENVLWVVSDNTGKIYKLETDGTISQVIDIDGEDLEGIVFDETNNTLWVVEEENRKLIHLSLNGHRLEEHLLQIPGSSNHGLEGICLDNMHHFWLLNEKEPGMLVELNPDFSVINKFDLNFASDYSGICFDKSSENFWIVSDESKEIFEWNPQSGMEKKFCLSFPKAEGVTLADKNSFLYIVSDSEEKLYVFQFTEE